MTINMIPIITQQMQQASTATYLKMQRDKAEEEEEYQRELDEWYERTPRTERYDPYVEHIDTSYPNENRIDWFPLVFLTVITLAAAGILLLAI